MLRISLIGALGLTAITIATAAFGGAEPVYSGPQVGEKATPFAVVNVTEPDAGKQRDLIAEFKGAPTTLVFVHGLERSIVPLLTVIDEYGNQKREGMRTVFVFLTADRIDSEKRLPLVKKSLNIQAPMVMSLDGPEGPGNYGLNKNCLMTIVVAKENKVTANFALVQPGIADAPAVIAAMAKACGDANPPTAEALRQRRQGGGPQREKTGPDRQRDNDKSQK